MKSPKNLPLLGGILAILWLTACSDNQDRQHALATPASIEADNTSANGAMEAGLVGPDLTDSSRKVARTADMRYRVREVLPALSGLERTVRAFGGAIVDSRLENRITQSRTQKQSGDSVVRLQGYEPVATLTVRVPADKLDTLLGLAISQAEFVDNRHLAADDATLRYLANAQKMAVVERSIPVTTTAAKSGDLPNRRLENVDRSIDNLAIVEQTRYATVTLELYQSERVDVQMLADTDTWLTPGFGQRFTHALGAGWRLVQWLFIGALEIWPVWLALAVVWMVLRRRGILMRMEAGPNAAG